MIYLDSSVALARLFGEPQTFPPSLWDEQLVSSQLLEYEVWNRIHAHGFTSAQEAARQLLARVELLQFDRDCLARALEPFPVPVRTLDSLHLASIVYLRVQQIDVALASFDRRMIAAARALGIPLHALGGTPRAGG